MFYLHMYIYIRIYIHIHRTYYLYCIILYSRFSLSLSICVYTYTMSCYFVVSCVIISHPVSSHICRYYLAEHIPDKMGVDQFWGPPGLTTKNRNTNGVDQFRGAVWATTPSDKMGVESFFRGVGGHRRFRMTKNDPHDLQIFKRIRR